MPDALHRHIRVAGWLAVLRDRNDGVPLLLASNGFCWVTKSLPAFVFFPAVAFVIVPIC